MADERYVRGLPELTKYLQELPQKLQRNVLRGALRSGAKIIRVQAAANVNKVSGELARGLKISTRSRGDTVTATIRATGKHGYIAAMVEFTGAKPHRIVAKTGALRLSGGAIVRAVDHPGFKKRPFLRPAADSEQGRAVVAVAEYIRTRLEKEGLDVADIEIDEVPA